MTILIDQNLSRKILMGLQNCLIRTAKQEGWSVLQNGDLLRVAEDRGFDILLTADQNLWYQQNNASRKISLVVLSTNHLKRIRKNQKLVLDALNRARPGSFEIVHIPFRLQVSDDSN